MTQDTQAKKWGDPPYIQVPRELLDDANGTANSNILWFALLHFATHKRDVVISLTDIQATSHLKGKRLEDAIQYFVDKKWLVVESHDESSSLYHLIGPWRPMVEKKDDKTE